MLPALENKAIDGYATSMPFTTQAVLKGIADHAGELGDRCAGAHPVRLRTRLHGAETCQKNREMCARMARAFAAAGEMVQEQAGRGLRGSAQEALRRRLDPELLKAAWEGTLRAHAKDIRVTIPQLENSQKISLEAKLLEPKDALKSFDGLYTDEFLKK